ncbi:cobaltochelatase subunit CobN [Pyrobaculum sp. 3827-6]|uniref:cobaltochelatase subunit CobN n=1 Tax=Pyrobaculum sp. 3827-6 TaxID=2983604 RepID=UPI0021D8E63C|nr:cobaltochelatase subunit CobN [Pyrobaculum sp. 3827-6]MCU7787537.1 cobaltochelatase subunit CobN [Pyrobaculum sp. 3827-6]
MRISVVLGYGGYSINIFRKVLEEEAARFGFEWLAAVDEVSEKYAELYGSSDAVFIYSHNLPEKVVDALKRGLASGAIKVCLNAGYLYNYPELVKPADVRVQELARRYYVLGGEKNLRSLVRYMLKLLDRQVEPDPPEELPWHFIYHPRLGIFNTTKEYLEKYDLRGRAGVVGLLYSRSYWLYGDRKPLDLLIEALEAEGLGVLPVVTYGYRDSSLGSPSGEDSVREFFIVEGRPVVDVVVRMQWFFLLDRGGRTRRQDRMNMADVSVLKNLGVPVINVAMSSYKDIKKWLEDPQGLDYLSLVYTVVMPEVDGLIEPIFYIGAKKRPDGSKMNEPYEEHARYIAKRVRRWVELRKKPPHERRIAIVLINPPCKGLEATIAVGFGLDVPESVVRLLHKLAELGYDVGDPEKLPKTGQDLIRIIKERKAHPDFRWTSVKMIVKNGGALDFVDYDTYMKWFEELPRDVREKMEKDWFHPKVVLEGNLPRDLKYGFTGMVWEGKFVVPGVRFGNVVIMPQPKFGCAGPACDGRICRILHDPTITPPHQWLAAYRWLTRIFKTDVVIHFGTHGYLEFRPGKGVGLDVSSWPEISIDDVPHLYVYNVANPMEGVIAKRRSYAVIIDHVYPPMALADVYEEIDKLLNDYARAKAVGDFERAKVVFEELVKKAREAHFKVPEGDVEKAVEEIHEQLDLVKDTQIEMGLHVFGHVDAEKVYEYAVAVMARDTAKFKSIRRVIAEWLGLDYDWMRREPLAVNKLGFTNRETIDLIYKAAVAALRRIEAEGVEKAEGILTEELGKLGVRI